MLIRQKLNLKPLSVNECWKGRRYKTLKYNNYEVQVLALLDSAMLPPAPYEISLTFGLSKNSDIDNPIKAFLDILQKKYSFNDKEIYKLNVNKEVKSKNEHFIKFEIKHYEPT